MSVTRSPVNVFATIALTLDRSHSGTTFWCEAQLDLGPAGPQPPPKMMSSPLNITVYCEFTLLLSFGIILSLEMVNIKKPLSLTVIISQQISPPSIPLSFQR